MSDDEVASLEAAADGAMRSGNRDAAVAHWQRLIAVKPDHPRALNGVGNWLLAKGKSAEACQYLERAVGAGGARFHSRPQSRSANLDPQGGAWWLSRQHQQAPRDPVEASELTASFWLCEFFSRRARCEIVITSATAQGPSNGQCKDTCKVR